MIKKILVIAYKDENNINRNLRFEQLPDTKQKMIIDILQVPVNCKHEHLIERISTCGLYIHYYCADCFMFVRKEKRIEGEE